MRKVCPQCQGTFEAQFLCPTCGVQLLDVPDRSAVISGVAAASGLPGASAGSQMLAALLVAQGLNYALHQLGTACTLWPGGPELPADRGHILLTALQVFGVLAGGFVAGAGNPRAAVAGAAIGLVNAIALVGAQFALGLSPPPFLLFAAWLPHAVFGAAGAIIGRRIWPSLLDLPDSAPAKAENTAAEPLPAPPAPTAWLRVLGGAALSVGCTVWAGTIRDGLIGSGGGAFVLESRLQGQFIAWAISALAMIFGGVFAGASSQAGLKHGFLVGLLAAAGLFVIHQEVVREVLPAERFFASVIGLPDLDAPTPAHTGFFVLTNTVLLGSLGGWFGGTLLPRLAGKTKGQLDRGSI